MVEFTPRVCAGRFARPIEYFLLRSPAERELFGWECYQVKLTIECEKKKMTHVTRLVVLQIAYSKFAVEGIVIFESEFIVPCCRLVPVFFVFTEESECWASVNPNPRRSTVSEAIQPAAR